MSNGFNVDVVLLVSVRPRCAVMASAESKEALREREERLRGTAHFLVASLEALCRVRGSMLSSHLAHRSADSARGPGDIWGHLASETNARSADSKPVMKTGKGRGEQS